MLFLTMVWHTEAYARVWLLTLVLLVSPRKGLLSSFCYCYVATIVGLLVNTHKCIVAQSICVVSNVAKLLQARCSAAGGSLTSGVYSRSLFDWCFTVGIKIFSFPVVQSEIIFQFAVYAFVHDKTTTKTEKQTKNNNIITERRI